MKTEAKSTRIKKPKNSVRIIVRGQTLSLVLPAAYCGKRHIFALDLPNTPDGKKFAEHRAKQIEIDLMCGQFDHTLAKYKPLKAASLIRADLTFAEIYQAYIESKKNLASPTTLKATYANTLNHLNGCPYKMPLEALKLKDWMCVNKTPDTARRILMQLNAACAWAAERNLIKTNPFFGKSKIKTKKSKAKIHPFSSNEKLAILAAFEESDKFNYLLPLINFFFLTGCRTSEALGLRWKNIKADCSSISFEEVMILGKGGAQRRQGTKQTPQRDFPCNKQLQNLLLSIKPSKPVGTAAVFLRVDDTPITHQDLRIAWYGKGVTLGIVRQLAADGAIENYRPQYNTRHTFISQCLEAGIPPLQISKWAGNSPEVIFKNYAGIINKLAVPEFL